MSDELQKSIFSKNLNYYMSKNNKTQTDIIEDLGINKSTISTWCNGTKPSACSMRKMVRLSICTRCCLCIKKKLISNSRKAAKHYCRRWLVSMALVWSFSLTDLMYVWRKTQKQKNNKAIPSLQVDFLDGLAMGVLFCEKIGRRLFFYILSGK